jgi:hypothetical protein
MLHVRLDLITVDPPLLGDSIGYIEIEVRPAVESQPGSLGMSLHADPERGVLVAESFWASHDALLDSEPIVAPSRDEAVRRAKGTAAVERYEVPVFEREAPFGAGEGVRLTRLDVEPRAAEDAIAWFGDTAVPWLADTDGFRGALLYADWASGHLISETVWRNPQALAASRSAAAAMQRAAVEATNCDIGAVEEYRLVFSTARTA